MSGSKIPRASGAATPSRVGAPVTPGLDNGPQTKNLDNGPQTSGLDAGVQTPGLDANPLKAFLPTESGEGRPVFRQPDYLLHEKPVRREARSSSQSQRMSHRGLGATNLPSFHVYSIKDDAGTITCLVKMGWVQGRDPTLGADPLAAFALPTIGGTAMATTRIVIEAAKTLYCRVETTSDDLVTTGGSTIVSETPTPASTHAQPAQQSIDMAETVAAVPGVYYYPIADFEEIGGRVRVANQYQSGGPIMHIPGRNGHASSIHFVDCDGGSLAFLNIRQGLETTNLGYKEIECGCDGGTTSSASPAATTYRQEGSEP